MAQEIERKFLVTGPGYRSGSVSGRIIQGFLIDDPERTVRIRIMNKEAFLTIKGPLTGATRSEFEYGIPLEDARELLTFCHPSLIEKVRYVVNCGDHRWEVDEFGGLNKGLVVAEIELKAETEQYLVPDWIGVEVTHDPRYYNANLVKNPFTRWGNK